MKPRKDTFKVSPREIRVLDKLYDEGKFVLHDNEMYMNVKAEDDTGEDRIVYGFGLMCPLPVKKGSPWCQSYRTTYRCCQSVISEKMARNFLAKHAFFGDCHSTKDNVPESFLAANNATLETVIETKEERNDDRELSLIQAKAKKRPMSPKSKKRPPSPRTRSRSRLRERGTVGGSSSSTAPPKFAAPPTFAPPSIAAKPSKFAPQIETIAPSKKPKTYVKIALKDLEQLRYTFEQALEVVDKTEVYLQFFSHQLTSERAVFTQAKAAIMELITQVPKAADDASTE
jgi:hypothetical protein